MNKYLNIIIFFFTLFSAHVRAQEVSRNNNLVLDTLTYINQEPTEVTLTAQKVDTIKSTEFKPDPIKVVWMGAIIPGYGQIMNRKYWKLPLVYGGFLGCAYAISSNSSRYQTYKNAYRDIIDTDPTTNSFIDILPEGRTVESMGGINSYATTLKTGQESYRRYRDLSIIASVAYYAITLVDAYVDAQLYDFDISPDLSMRFQPALIENRSGMPTTLALQCSFRLK